MFDFVRDMRDDLDRLAEIFTLTLTIQDVPIDFAAREIRVARQILVGEPLVVPEIQICLRTVIRHEDFSVLERAHRSRIHIHVGIEFLAGDAETAHFQKSAQRCRCYSFSEAGDDASGYKYIFCHVSSLHTLSKNI